MTVGLPDELWMVVLQAGLDSGMDYREFCTCALVSRFFKRLSSADHFWEQLWQKDWPSTSSHDGANSRSALANQKAPFVASDMLKSVTAPHGADSKNGGCSKPDRRFGGGIWKASFRERFERDKARRVASHRRKVFRVQSQVALLEAEMVDLRGAVDSERTKWTTALQQIQQVENSERALVASKVWQPQAVATRHQQLLEQHPLDASAQLNALRQEAAICREHVTRFSRNLKQKEETLRQLRQDLAALTYSPAKDLPSLHVPSDKPREVQDLPKTPREGSSSSQKRHRI